MTNIETYLKKLETEGKIRGYSKGTLKMYVFHCKKFLEYTDMPVKNITVSEIKEYLAYILSDRNVRHATARHALASIRFFFQSVMNKDMPYIKPPKLQQTLPVILSKAEVKTILEHTTNEKHRLIIELLYSTGLRLSECVNLKYEDLDLDQNIGWVRMGKGAKDRIFLLSETFKHHLIEYHHKKPDQEYIFSKDDDDEQMSPRGIQKAIEHAVKLSGITKKVHVHTFRHSFATHLLEADVDIRKIQKLLGHSSLMATQIYTQVSSEQIRKIKSPLDSL